MNVDDTAVIAAAGCDGVAGPVEAVVVPPCSGSTCPLWAGTNAPRPLGAGRAWLCATAAVAPTSVRTAAIPGGESTQRGLYDA